MKATPETQEAACVAQMHLNSARNSLQAAYDTITRDENLIHDFGDQRNDMYSMLYDLSDIIIPDLKSLREHYRK